MEEHRLAPPQRRDVLLSAGAVAALSLLAWFALVRMARTMGATDSMAAMDMPSPSPWTAVELVQLWLMWSIMMAAMMLPSTAPVVLLFTRVGRQRQARGEPAPRLLFLLAGYLLVWSGFSLFAALAQQALHNSALLTPAMAFGRPALAAGLLFAAAAYQWSPPKQACLRACRSPFYLFVTEWREGWWGALRLGARHGMFCVACCWLLMALLFVAGNEPRVGGPARGAGAGGADAAGRRDTWQDRRDRVRRVGRLATAGGGLILLRRRSIGQWLTQPWREWRPPADRQPG